MCEARWAVASKTGHRQLAARAAGYLTCINGARETTGGPRFAARRRLAGAAAIVSAALLLAACGGTTARTVTRGSTAPVSVSPAASTGGSGSLQQSLVQVIDKVAPEVV
ncbi:MAG: hypothetical protein ACYC0H_18435, partial [Solirubrobacteraceae bacterium]